MIAILSLALGIGANTAIFTLLDQLLLRMLPIQNPDEIVQVASSGSHYGNNQGREMLSHPMYRDLRDKNETLVGMLARREDSMTVSFGTESERVLGEVVSGNYFQPLGVGPTLGRVLTSEDDRTPGGHPVVVLAYDYWQSRFNADPKSVGQKIVINNYPMTIVGVSAAGFAGLSPGVLPKVRLPLAMRKEINPRGGQLEERRSRWVQVFGRRKAGVTKDQVKPNLQSVFRQVISREVSEKAFATASSYTREKFLQMNIRIMPGRTGRGQLAATDGTTAAGPDGDSWAGVVDCLRQPGDSVDRAGERSGKGNCNSAVDRRDARTDHSIAGGREFSSIVGWRRAERLPGDAALIQ